MHYNDFVPHLPPKILGFYHYSPEVWYTKRDSSAYVICTNIEDKSCSKSVNPWKWSGDDHNHYIGVTLYCEDQP